MLHTGNRTGFRVLKHKVETILLASLYLQGTQKSPTGTDLLFSASFFSFYLYSFCIPIPVAPPSSSPIFSLDNVRPLLIRFTKSVTSSHCFQTKEPSHPPTHTLSSLNNVPLYTECVTPCHFIYLCYIKW